MSDRHLSPDARRRLARPIGGRAHLLPMRDLTPEQACWVIPPSFAWSVIAPAAHARLSGVDRYGLLESDVNPGELEQFIDDMFVDPSWLKGTEMTSFEDWGNNFSQAFNFESSYYDRATKLGEKLLDEPFLIDIAGHSQGGGLCAAASSVSGKACWSFNAAGLHPKTVERYGGTLQPSEINAYHVKGEILTTLQSWLPLPVAIGTPYILDGKGSSISRHFISQVIDGIEKQKQEDISILQEVPL
ncbi:hypothetical protein [Trinickia mobilis]|uniref:hypothetical protein n=1 Tax=Trinickia mobilis TaxID=2816356 RepID=UPI001A8C1062|nr:hypothetical protein [Trinickia mobilis]